MKILLVNKFFYLKGGSERYMFTLADALEKNGHEVIFFCMQDDKNLECNTSKYFVSNKSIDGSFINKIKFVLSMVYSKEAYKKMSLLLNEEKPDLIILNLVHKQITCSIIQATRDYSKDIPIFWTVHDLIHVCPSYTMLDGKGNICEKCLSGDFSNCSKNKCCHNSKFMSALSAHEAKQIKKHGWYNDVDLYICPSEFYKNKLEEAHFTKSRIICLRNPLSGDMNFDVFDHDKRYLLYFGRLSKEKGVQTLLSAMKYIDYKLYVLGSGPIEDELKQYVLTNGITNVEFKGFCSGNELEEYIKNCRCVVLPSEWYENGPYSATEAMAYGKPLIVSNKGGLPELIRDNGFVFSNEKELIEKINLLINLNQNEYSAMCNNSLLLAKTMFNSTNYIDSLMREKEILK